MDLSTVFINDLFAVGVSIPDLECGNFSEAEKRFMLNDEDGNPQPVPWDKVAENAEKIGFDSVSLRMLKAGCPCLSSYEDQQEFIMDAITTKARVDDMGGQLKIITKEGEIKDGRIDFLQNLLAETKAGSGPSGEAPELTDDNMEKAFENYFAKRHAKAKVGLVGLIASSPYFHVIRHHMRQLQIIIVDPNKDDGSVVGGPLVSATAKIDGQSKGLLAAIRVFNTEQLKNGSNLRAKVNEFNSPLYRNALFGVSAGSRGPFAASRYEVISESSTWASFMAKTFYKSIVPDEKLKVNEYARIALEGRAVRDKILQFTEITSAIVRNLKRFAAYPQLKEDITLAWNDPGEEFTGKADAWLYTIGPKQPNARDLTIPIVWASSSSSVSYATVEEIPKLLENHFFEVGKIYQHTIGSRKIRVKDLIKACKNLFPAIQGNSIVLSLTPCDLSAISYSQAKILNGGLMWEGFQIVLATSSEAKKFIVDRIWTGRREELYGAYVSTQSAYDASPISGKPGLELKLQKAHGAYLAHRAHHTRPEGIQDLDLPATGLKKGAKKASAGQANQPMVAKASSDGSGPLFNKQFFDTGL